MNYSPETAKAISGEVKYDEGLLKAFEKTSKGSLFWGEQTMER